MSQTMGTDGEIGLLRAVLVHRPGPELKRITPRIRNTLLFDGLPWVARAQQEHDMFAQALSDRGTEVLYVTELLTDVLECASARDEAIASVLTGPEFGDELRSSLRGYLESLAPEALASVLIGGLPRTELRTGRGVVFELLDPHDFVIEPLPNLVFVRDSSVWIGDQVIIARLAGQRRREAELLGVIYGHHRRFAGLKRRYHAGPALIDGGDVLLLGPGVVALGIGAATTPAAVERLAGHLLRDGLARTVLAVPMTEHGQAVQLDAVCMVVDAGTVVMAPSLAFSLTAHAITLRGCELRVSRPRPFLEAAAEAMSIDRIEVIDTGLDPAYGKRAAWDFGGNALAVDRRVTVCNERNAETNSRLAAAGVEVIAVPASELAGPRGGPRCLCVPVSRSPAAAPDLTGPGLSTTGTGERRAAGGLRVLVATGLAADAAHRRQELTPAG